MAFKKDKIIKELGLVPFGQQGWLSSHNLECLHCGKKDKLGIKFTNTGGVVHCFKCSSSISVFEFISKINRKDLLEFGYEASLKVDLKTLTPSGDIKNNKPIKRLPHGIKPFKNNNYLDCRSFLPEHYSEFEPSYTYSFLERKLHNYIIFKIKQRGVLFAWLARSTHSKEWHEKNLKASKEGIEDLKLRYRNSEGSDFTEFLGGLDDITENTHTVIIVEGIFDKVNTDKKLNLFQNEDIRCCFTFGNKVSDAQVNLLRGFKNIKTIILLYDFNTIKQSKSYSLKLGKYFDVFVGKIENPELDPGNMSIKDFNIVLNSLESAINFYAYTISSSLCKQ